MRIKCHAHPKPLNYIHMVHTCLDRPSDACEELWHEQWQHCSLFQHTLGLRQPSDVCPPAGESTRSEQGSCQSIAKNISSCHRMSLTVVQLLDTCTRMPIEAALLTPAPGWSPRIDESCVKLLLSHARTMPDTQVGSRITRTKHGEHQFNMVFCVP